MNTDFYTSKEEIRNRILRNAKDFWNIKDGNEFDPLVKLILEVLSNELFNVSNDVKNLENRIFDKISRILAPDHLTSALPAHAILHARPLENIDFISPKAHFTFKKTLVSEESKGGNKHQDIFFSPLHKVKLFNAEIKYMATGQQMFLLADQNKTLAANTLPGFSVEPNTVYLGFTGFSDVKSLSGLNFFFDWKNYALPDHTYELLSLVRWYIHDEQIAAFSERFMEEEFRAPDQAAFRNKQLLNLIKADILQFYAQRFLTLDDVEYPIEYAKRPASFDAIFQPAALNRISDDLIWLKLVFPAAISQEMLNELHISINAFPVVNKKLISVKHRLKVMSNIIPVKTEDIDQMLAVDSLKDNREKNYNEIPYTNEDEKGDGSFSIRYGGTERFDTRNAKELIDYLFELLRDEKAAFSAYGPDFMSTALKNLEQTITLIEQKSRTSLKNVKEMPGYIVVKPLDGADIVFLDIWITQTEEANRIHVGSKLMLFENNNKLAPESIRLLTQSKGGRSRLNAANRVQAYKYGLTTADRIVTKSDIINFCHHELADRILSVSLEKGLMLKANPNEGFVRTTDIVIVPNLQANLSTEDWDELLELTLAKLKLRSSMHVNYRLLIKEKTFQI
ncbi:hypothetical protein ACJVDH_18315 [Pedobacter sp. AW1-32]|uniref:type VI secretion system baseplate subunit TssF n=1 Tax=Pedobacter sp. AW1-32 TaxID=3383026 RepID=UPI003FEED12B